MKTIYKYILEITDRQSLNLPLNSKILSVENQGDNMYLWAMVDKEQDIHTLFEIEILGTGHIIYTNKNTVREFLGTVIMPNGFVGHVFNRIS